jgi:hypothetical protein
VGGGDSRGCVLSAWWEVGKRSGKYLPTLFILIRVT